MLVLLTLCDFAQRGEYSLQSAVAVVQRRCVIRNDGLLAEPVTRVQLIVGYLSLAQRQPDARVGAIRIGEKRLERRTNELIASAAGERFHLFVDVGDDARGI